MAIKLSLRNSQDSESCHKNLLYQQVFNFFGNRDEIKLQSLTFGFTLVNRPQIFALGDINPPLIFRLISKMVTAFYFFFFTKLWSRDCSSVDVVICLQTSDTVCYLLLHQHGTLIKCIVLCLSE